MPFNQPNELPQLMVSPNVSRKMNEDHPAVPLSIPEIVNTLSVLVERSGQGLKTQFLCLMDKFPPIMK